ncbi:MAG TPA: 4-demethylwyosine synthase TYW1 [Candidatus Bathyarchaeia archaeon]|nr:4-demethylwyosine synthase TYW1 [Candidatus Bathyarchaeia archaeon]
MRRKKLHTPTSYSYRQTLARQGYQCVGCGGAVKACLWLKKSLRNEGTCYKEQFYGIHAHQCIQMTPTLQCNQQCLHCWRIPELDTTTAHVFDEPQILVDESIAAQRRLISGYKGSATTDTQKLEEAYNPTQVAISLSGEPTIYPYLDELVKRYHEKHMTTFIVSNGSHPEVLDQIRPTQLYVSLNSPDEEHFYAMCRPQTHQFNRLLESLRVLADHPSRTAIRITLANEVNAFGEQGYANLVELAEPDYIEVKSYMHLGFSRKRLPRTAMMSYDAVLSFAHDIAERIGYAVAGGASISRVAVLSRSGSTTPIAD